MDIDTSSSSTSSIFRKRFLAFSNYKYTITGLIISAILLLTVSVLLLTHLHSSATLYARPVEDEKNVKYVHKQSVKDHRVTSNVPFDIQLDMNVKPGTEFHVVGVLLSTDERFTIDLRSSHTVTATSVIGQKNIPFHFNPRLLSSPHFQVDRDTFLLSSKIDGVWSSSSLIYPKPFSIQPGTKFRIQIKCEEEQYRISIDGVAIAVFEYRLPIESITHLFMTGELEVDMVEIKTP